MFRILFGLLLIFSANLVFARPTVLVSVLPQKFIVQQLAGDSVAIEVVVGKGISPENFQPTAQTIVRIARADLFVRTGLPFETPLLSRLLAINPDLTVLDMRRGLAQHSADPHIWTDPLAVLAHAGDLRRVLTEITPASADRYAQHYQDFSAVLIDLDLYIRQQLSSLRQRQFLAYHPAWSYFAVQYNLTQLAVEVEGKEPAARQMIALIDQVEAADIKFLLVQPQHNGHSAQVFANETATIVETVDPLGENYIAELKKMTRLLKEYHR